MYLTIISILYSKYLLGMKVKQYHLVLLVLFIPVLALASPVVGEEGLAGSCEPGQYVVNSTGTFICVPEFKEQDLPFISIRIDFNSSGIYVTLVAFDPRGLTGTLQLSDPNMNPIYTIDVELGEGEIKTYNVPLPDNYGYDYIIVNGTINGYDLGTFAVSKSMDSVLDLSSLMQTNAKIGFIIVLAVVAPFIGVALRGNPREAGLGLVALGVLYVPLMHVMGLQSPIPEFLGVFAIITGIVMAAINPHR